jgi:hypothetical protein
MFWPVPLRAAWKLRVEKNAKTRGKKANVGQDGILRGTGSPASPEHLKVLITLLLAAGP